MKIIYGFEVQGFRLCSIYAFFRAKGRLGFRIQGLGCRV